MTAPPRRQRSVDGNQARLVRLFDGSAGHDDGSRLELARRIVESVVTEQRVNDLVSDGVRRIEEVITGKVRGLSEEEYRQAVG